MFSFLSAASLGTKLAIIGAILAAVFATGFGSAWRIQAWHCAAREKAAVEAALTAYKAEATKAAAASATLETKRDAIRERTRTIVKTVDRIVERPVYRNVCIEPDGVRLINDALRPPTAAGQPDGPLPSTDADRGRDGGKRAPETR